MVVNLGMYYVMVEEGMRQEASAAIDDNERWDVFARYINVLEKLNKREYSWKGVAPVTWILV